MIKLELQFNLNTHAPYGHNAHDIYSNIPYLHLTLEAKDLVKD